MIYLSNHKGLRPIYKFLVTNDDGILSEAIDLLARSLMPFGHVTVIAPTANRSGVGHSITALDAMRLKKMHSENRLDMYACTGMPADCIKIGIDALMSEKPDFIFSGINLGTNTGQAVFSSGTMAAAREACYRGFPAFALSAVRQADRTINLAMLSELLPLMIPRLLDFPLAQDSFLNINLPACDLDQIKGYKCASMNPKNLLFNAEQATDARGRQIFWLNKVHKDLEQEELLIQEGYIVVTPIELPTWDETKFEAIEEWLNRE